MNQKQATITKARLAELIRTKDEFEEQELDKKNAKYFLGIDSLNSLISELEKEIFEYEGLVNGSFHCLQAKNINEIPKVLIAGRLAQKMSQKILGGLVGLKEQQIQRYEATDYETSSWSRVIEIAKALQLNLKFEKNIIINDIYDEIFKHPESISKEQIEAASLNIQFKKSLIL